MLISNYDLPCDTAKADIKVQVVHSGLQVCVLSCADIHTRQWVVLNDDKGAVLCSLSFV